MAVVREQFAIVSDSVTINNNTTGVLTLVKPKDPLEGNTIDFVARPHVCKEFHQGRMVIGLGETFGVADIYVHKIEVFDLTGSVSLRTVVDVSTDDLEATLQTTKDLLSSLVLREGEGVVKVTLKNATGSNLTGRIVARFDLGLNAANYGSVPATL